MIIHKESILNKLPSEKLNEKEIILFESIVHLVTTLNISYDRLKSMLLKNADDLAEELLMIDVWHIIDTSHRLRCILEKTPGIKKNEPWFQLTLRKLQKTEDIRNFIQHYNREIDSLLTNVKPLLGHLSWYEDINDKEFKVVTIIPGNIRKFQGLGVVNPAGRLIRDKIDLITFYIGNCKISLSDIFYQLIEFIVGIEKHIEVKARTIHQAT